MHSTMRIIGRMHENNREHFKRIIVPSPNQVPVFRCAVDSRVVFPQTSHDVHMNELT